MSFIIQALIRAFVPALLSIGSGWLRKWISTARHEQTRPYIEQIFQILLDFAKDPQTAVPSHQAETVVKGLRSIVYALLDGGGETGTSDNIQPWVPKDEK